MAKKRYWKPPVPKMMTGGLRLAKDMPKPRKVNTSGQANRTTAQVGSGLRLKGMKYNKTTGRILSQ